MTEAARKQEDRVSTSIDIKELYSMLNHLCKAPGYYPIDWLRQLVHQHLDTRESGIEFVSTIDHFVHLLLMKHNTGRSSKLHVDRDTTVKTLHFYNAIVSRLLKLHVPLTKDTIFWGVYLAAEGQSASGMMRYLQAFRQYGVPFKHESADRVLHSVKRWVMSDSFSGWEGLRRKQELFTVFTGYRSDRSVDFGERRQECIRNLINDDAGKIGLVYVATLQSFASAEALYDEWLHFTKSERWQRCLVSRDGLRYSEALKYVEAFIMGFISTGDIERAWAVVNQSSCKPGELSEVNWSDLLDHPEYIEKWQDGMSEHVLRKYEQHLVLIENALGVQWSGDMHIPVSKDDREDLLLEHVGNNNS